MAFSGCQSGLIDEWAYIEETVLIKSRWRIVQVLSVVMVCFWGIMLQRKVNALSELYFSHSLWDLLEGFRV